MTAPTHPEWIDRQAANERATSVGLKFASGTTQELEYILGRGEHDTAEFDSKAKTHLAIAAPLAFILVVVAIVIGWNPLAVGELEALLGVATLLLLAISALRFTKAAFGRGPAAKAVTVQLLDALLSRHRKAGAPSNWQDVASLRLAQLPESWLLEAKRSDRALRALDQIVQVSTINQFKQRHLNVGTALLLGAPVMFIAFCIAASL